MPAPLFITDSLAVAQATPKRRHIDLKVSLTAALNEFVDLGLFERSKSTEGHTLWNLVGGPIVAQEAFYVDVLNRQFVSIQLTRDAALGVVLRARHAGDRAALVEAIRHS